MEINFYVNISGTGDNASGGSFANIFTQTLEDEELRKCLKFNVKKRMLHIKNENPQKSLINSYEYKYQLLERGKVISRGNEKKIDLIHKKEKQLFSQVKMPEFIYLTYGGPKWYKLLGEDADKRTKYIIEDILNIIKYTLYMKPELNFVFTGFSRGAVEIFGIPELLVLQIIKKYYNILQSFMPRKSFKENLIAQSHPELSKNESNLSMLGVTKKENATSTNSIESKIDIHLLSYFPMRGFKDKSRKWKRWNKPQPSQVKSITLFEISGNNDEPFFIKKFDPQESPDEIIQTQVVLTEAQSHLKNYEEYNEPILFFFFYFLASYFSCKIYFDMTNYTLPMLEKKLKSPECKMNAICSMNKKITDLSIPWKKAIHLLRQACHIKTTKKL